MRPVRNLALTLGAIALATASTQAAVGAPQRDSAPDLSASQWDMVDIRAAEANTVATGRRITVAVIDTGVDIDHPEFRRKLVDPVSWICPPGVAAPCEGLRYVDDGHGHGTHVAGTVAAKDDGSGITGVAPDARIMPIRVGDDEGSISGDLVGAMRYATAHGADVITMSIGYVAGTGPVFDNPVFPIDEFGQAVQEASDAGILVTLAAGNDAVPYCGQGEFWQDAALCVGAYGPDDDPAVYSDWGYEIDVNAPGGGILTCAGSITSTAPLDVTDPCTDVPGFQTMSGTSMAAPHVAGVGALLAQQGVTGTAAAERIVESARTDVPVSVLGVTGPRLDAAASVGLG